MKIAHHETPDKEILASSPADDKNPANSSKRPNEALQLTQQNESASKKKQGSPPKEKPFALRDLDPEEMREINELLQEYIEIPRPFSMPRRVLVPSPDMRPEALKDEDLTDLQRRELFEI